MKLYLVTANHYSYDEYDSFVVWAKSPEEAEKLAIAESGCSFIKSNFLKGCVVAEIEKPKESGIVLGSYNAG